MHGTVNIKLWYPLKPLSPTASTFSAMWTPDVKTPGPLASLVDPDESWGGKKIQRNPEVPNKQLKEIHKCITLATCTGEVKGQLQRIACKNLEEVPFFCLFVFFLHNNPPVGQGLLILEISRSYTTTHQSR